MPLSPGSRLGPYEIIAPLGAGGMGEVYRARDTKLSREVALKTLPDIFTHDQERLARFQREAQVLAALNHPHIGSIYGLEEAGAQRVLVLEFVEGETLADRVARGPLPLDEALAIAREIAEALQAAHDKGIVHRDLKPANIALTRDDRVKVLDFGLARAGEGSSVAGTASPINSPTITSPAVLTGVGMLLGTAAYMSPEQARGRVADKRSDVWAFGCVLYEMLTGRRPFEGDDVSDTLASVLKSAPVWEYLPASVPPAVRALLVDCLEKEPRNRIGDFSAVLYALKHARTLPVPSAPPQPPQRARWWSRVALLVAGGAIGGIALAAFLLARAPDVPAPITRFSISLPPGRELSLSRRGVTISPDGTRVVYSAGATLYSRSIFEFESRPIASSTDAIQPEVSPDSQSVLFWGDAGLMRIAATGGVPVRVCDTAPAPYGLKWSDHGITFVQPGRNIMRVSPNGGEPSVLVRVTPADGIAQRAELLPDGDTVLFTLVSASNTSIMAWDRASIMAYSIRNGQRKTLISGGSDGRYVPTGHLVYLVEGTLMGVRFDAEKLEVTSGAVPVVEGIRRAAAAAGGEGQFAFSASGTLAYVPGPARSGQQQVFLYDRKGNVEPLRLPRGSYSYPRVSPDGKRLALETNDGKQAAVAVYELSGASSIRRLTFGGNNRLPIWSADGRRVAFQSDREGDRGIFWQAVEGGIAERLTRAEPATEHIPEAWSPRGDVFLFSVRTGAGSSLWLYSLTDRRAATVGDVSSAGFPTDAVFSPDGRWVAYQAGDADSGEAITYVQPFPPNGTKYQIARGGRPLWSRDGKELFFVPGPSQFSGTFIRTHPTFAFSEPYPIPRRFGLAPPADPRPYDILPDGRLVGVDFADQGGSLGAQEIRVVQNWFAELKAKVPVK